MMSLKTIGIAATILLFIFCLSKQTQAADEETCLGCHGYSGLSLQAESRAVRDLFIDEDAFNGSVHGSLPCRGCHIDILKIPHENKEHEVNCGISCHGGSEGETLSHAKLYNRFLETAHGKALGRGPDCLHCHDVNEQPDHTASVRAKTEGLCAECHVRKTNEDSSDKRPGPMVSDDVYHRLSSARNFRSTPECVDCHPVHAIYPGTTEQSSVHPDNIEATCNGDNSLSEKCHSGRSEQLLGAGVHNGALAARRANTAGSGTIWLVVMVLTVPLALHMVFDATRSPRTVSVDIQEEKKNLLHVFTRMTGHQRALHFLLMFFFILASAGGLALRLSDRPLAARLIDASGGFERMASIHLAAGVALGVLSVYHIVSLIYLSIRRDWVFADLALLPNADDFKQIIQNAKFLLFISPEPARFGRYSFIQKFDYLTALFGLSLMLATGLAVGFPEWSVLLIPPSSLESLRTLHSALGYVLVFVFLVWHVYHNFLAPGRFLANWSWIIGTMPERMAATYHAAQLDEELRRVREEKLKKEKAAEERSMHAIVKKQSRRLESFLEAGNRFAKEKKFAEAIEQYRNALELLPNFPQAQYNIATVYHQSGNLVQAAVEYRKFIEMDPFNVMAEKVKSVLRELEEPTREEPADEG